MIQNIYTLGQYQARQQRALRKKDLHDEVKIRKIRENKKLKREKLSKCQAENAIMI